MYPYENSITMDYENNIWEDPDYDLIDNEEDEDYNEYDQYYYDYLNRRTGYRFRPEIVEYQYY